MENFSERAVAILQKANVPIVVLVVASIIGASAYSFMKSKHKKQLEVSQNELFVIRKEVLSVSEKINPPEPTPEFGKDGKPLPAKPKKEAPKYSDADKEKEFTAVLEKLNNYIKANQGTQGAVEGAIIVAEITSDYKKYEEGITALKTALNGFDKNNFLFGIAQTELGNLLVKTDKCNDAAQAWEAVISQKSQDYLANDLRLKAGICYEKSNQLDRAETHYQAIVEKAPESSSARTAKKFLLHIKYVKAKGPSPEPKKG